MNESTIFIGGSRHILRLPVEIEIRLDSIMKNGHRIIVGDANGADKSMQKYLHDANYEKVTVFVSGSESRNNLGQWETRHIGIDQSSKNFNFYAAKDRAMAHEADFGLMVWDGKSPGTVLNVLRLIRLGKISVLFHAPEKCTINIKMQSDWDKFLNQLGDEMVRDLRKRATPEEWQPKKQSGLFEATCPDGN